MACKSLMEEELVLCKAAYEGDLDVVIECLQNGSSIDAEYEGDTLLDLALMCECSEKCCHSQIVTQLLLAGCCISLQNVFKAIEISNEHTIEAFFSSASIDTQDENGVTALMYAAENGRVDVCQNILDQKCNVNICDSNGMTALMYAASNNLCKKCRKIAKDVPGIDVSRLCRNFDHHPGSIITEKMIQASCDLNQIDINGRTALIHAAKTLEFSTLKLLVDVNCYLDCQDTDGKTALYHAIAKRHIISVKYLVESGCNIELSNSDGVTPLMIAVHVGSLDIITLLIEAGSDVNKVNRLNQTALIMAIDEDCSELVEPLIEAGCDVNVKDNDHHTAIWYAVDRWNSSSLLPLLQCGKVDYNILDENGLTAIHLTVEYEYGDMLLEMHENGVDLEVLDCMKRTPIMYAIHLKCYEIFKLLLQCMKGVNQKDSNGYTIAHYAIESQDNRIFKKVIKSEKCDLCVCDFAGRTVLIHAVKKGNLNFVSILLNANVCDVNKVDDYGYSALSYAVDQMDYDICQSLLDAGAKSYRIGSKIILKPKKERNISIKKSGNTPNDAMSFTNKMKDLTQEIMIVTSSGEIPLEATVVSGEEIQSSSRESSTGEINTNAFNNGDILEDSMKEYVVATDDGTEWAFDEKERKKYYLLQEAFLEDCEMASPSDLSKPVIPYVWERENWTSNLLEEVGINISDRSGCPDITISELSDQTKEIQCFNRDIAWYKDCLLKICEWKQQHQLDHDALAFALHIFLSVKGDGYITPLQVGGYFDRTGLMWNDEVDYLLVLNKFTGNVKAEEVPGSLTDIILKTDDHSLSEYTDKSGKISSMKCILEFETFFEVQCCRFTDTVNIFGCQLQFLAKVRGNHNVHQLIFKWTYTDSVQRIIKIDVTPCIDIGNYWNKIWNNKTPTGEPITEKVYALLRQRSDSEYRFLCTASRIELEVVQKIPERFRLGLLMCKIMKSKYVTPKIPNQVSRYADHGPSSNFQKNCIMQIAASEASRISTCDYVEAIMIMYMVNKITYDAASSESSVKSFIFNEEILPGGYYIQSTSCLMMNLVSQLKDTFDCSEIPEIENVSKVKKKHIQCYLQKLSYGHPHEDFWVTECCRPDWWPVDVLFADPISKKFTYNQLKSVFRSYSQAYQKAKSENMLILNEAKCGKRKRKRNHIGLLCGFN